MVYGKPSSVTLKIIMHTIIIYILSQMFYGHYSSRIWSAWLKTLSVKTFWNSEGENKREIDFRNQSPSKSGRSLLHKLHT